ncbi:hypothetical protein AYO21_06866 [Fonsecaea monophora]|uniref:Peptidase C14 caspase domain-containing protein n=1 Tax=Fonsecaea monophora TaxID=254056 RepID=A0A177F3F5_9EURO|nr:hypothetical protein AYO21_06866 [Fonsecaea monophora]OAG38835.1 hypothetical protein AYO21_06866 [Fonsecaea monophora]
MKPGTCGYFDKSGFWSKLFDLNDSSSLLKHSLGDAQDTNSELRDNGITWDPKVSRGTSKIDVGLEAGVNTGLPVDIAAKLKVATSTDFGAVLVTTPNIHHHRVYQESDIRPWWSRNKRKLLQANFKYEVARYGLFIVTGTYTTTNCSITAWSDTSSDVYLGFEADVTGLPAGVRVHGGWVLGGSASGWNHYDAPVFTSIKTDNNMRAYDEDNQAAVEDQTARVGDLDFVCERVAERDETKEDKTSREPSKWAVLVGINDYINPKDDTRPPIQNLRGCVADVDAMWTYFKETLGMDDEHISILTAPFLAKARSKSPTKQNIVGAIKETCGKASPKDLVYIHFSGHGARLKQDGGTYVLVPTDVKEKTGGVLKATELKDLLRQMLEKELIVTVVLDCCHSSGISHGDRSHETSPREEGGGDNVAVRGLDDLESILWDGENTDSETQAGEAADFDHGQGLGGNDEQGRSLSMADHWLVPSGGEYTVIAACRELEKAYEVKSEKGNWQGVLTLCIDRLLRNTDALVHGLPGLSYWRLQWHIAEAVQLQLGGSRQQNVLIKGAMDRAFFGDSELEVLDAPVIIELNKPVDHGNRVRLSTSKYLGARVGSTFDIYPLTTVGAGEKGQPLDRLAVCTIKSAKDLKDGNADAIWTEISTGSEKQIIVGCPAVPQDEIFVRLVKKATGHSVEVEAADHEAIREAWRSSTSRYAKLVSDDFKGPTCVQVAVDEEKPEYQIFDRKGEVVSTLAFRPQDETAPVALVNHTMHLARFYSAFEMSTSSQGKALVKMRVLGEISPNGEESTQPIHTVNLKEAPHVPDYVKPWNEIEADGTIIFRPGNIIALAIDNVTDETVHVALICLDMSNWSIIPVHPKPRSGNTGRLDVPVTLNPGHRVLLPIRYETPKGASKQSEAHKEMLKVIAATSPRDFNALLLPPIEETGRGGNGESSEGGFWGLFEDILEQDRPLTAGSLRKTVKFDIKQQVVKVVPVSDESANESAKGMDWDAALGY